MSVTPHVLTNVTASPGEDFDPTWSPDGTKIAFVSGRDGKYEIYVLDLALPGAARRITDHPADAFSPL